MKHLVPEYTFDPETEYGISVQADVTLAYAGEYRAIKGKPDDII